MNDQQQLPLFRGRGCARGRGRGSFGNGPILITSRTNSISDLNNDSETNNNQQQSIPPTPIGRGGVRGGRGNGQGNSNNVGSRPNSLLDINIASINDQQPQFSNRGRGGRGGGRGTGGRGSVGTGSVFNSRTNSFSDLNNASDNSNQQQQSIPPRGRGIGRGGRGIGRGNFNNYVSCNNSFTDINSAVTNDQQQQTGRGGRGGTTRIGRGAASRGNYGSGANSVPLLESISVERQSFGGNNNLKNGGFERNQRPRRQSDSNSSSNDEFTRRRLNNYYVPIDRPIDEIFAEDHECEQKYIDVTDSDDLVEMAGIGNVEVMGQMIIDSWDQLNLHSTLYENIVEKSMYIRPRKIQSRVIPYIIEGFDLKGHSETGSGKTAAFAIPIIQKILINSHHNSRSLCGPVPLAIIIEPTRELCIQVYDQFRKFANGTFIKVCKLYGETSMRVALQEIQRGCDILVCTPGRIRHFISAKFIDPSNVEFFVLDEADHMLNTHFIEDIRIIIPIIPPNDRRQSLLFSATFPPEIQLLASEILKKNYVLASNKKPVSPNSKIIHTFLEVETKKKKEFLLDLLIKELEETDGRDKNNNPKLRRTLVFVETRRDADILAVYLSENKIKASTVNGERKQCEREEALRRFDKGEIDVLVATNLLHRGIDIKNLNHVINFDLPNDNIEYVHRTGRTGRLGVGYATSFVDPKYEKDAAMIPNLIDLLQESDIEFPSFMDLNGKLQFTTKLLDSDDIDDW